MTLRKRDQGPRKKGVLSSERTGGSWLRKFPDGTIDLRVHVPWTDDLQGLLQL